KVAPAATPKAGTEPAVIKTADASKDVPKPAPAKASKSVTDTSMTMNAKAATKATVTPITERTGDASSVTGPVNKSFVPYQMKEGEEYMNEAQKEHFKRILLNWRNELMQEVDRTVHHMQDEAANPPDPADRAT